MLGAPAAYIEKNFILISNNFSSSNYIKLKSVVSNNFFWPSLNTKALS